MQRKTLFLRERYTDRNSKFGQWQYRRFRFAAGAANCKDEDADAANGQILNCDVYTNKRTERLEIGQGCDHLRKCTLDI